MPIHLASNQSMGEGQLRRKRFGKEIGLEPRMEQPTRQVDSRFRFRYRLVEAIVSMEIDGTCQWRRPRKTWWDCVRVDMESFGPVRMLI